MKKFTDFLSEGRMLGSSPRKYTFVEGQSAPEFKGDQQAFHNVLEKHGFDYTHSKDGHNYYTHSTKGKAHVNMDAAQYATAKPNGAASNHMTTYQRFDSDRRPQFHRNGPRDLDDHLSKS